LKGDSTKLDRAFNPQCIVVVGDKADNDFMWLRAQSAFKGKLYSVQIDPKEIEGIKALGVKNYASLLDVPDPVDLVIVSVPRAIAPRILEDCIRKEVAAAHFFTAGFAETATEEGERLESLLIEKAKRANFHLIGPNCMGIFNPKVGVKQPARQYTGFAGPVGFISQSGTHATVFSLEAHLQGIDINKSVSFGNGAVLDSTDYLEYFGSDADIKVIAMYLEGVKNGRRFLSVLREVSTRKPVLIWKGGRTKEGGRASASHTGSLAIPQAIWDVAVRQSGAIEVKSLEELIDALKALLYLSPVRGSRLGIVGGSGGQAVAISDAFAEAAFEVPLLSQKSYDELTKFFTLIGGSYRNPIDTGNVNYKEIKRIMEILEQDANIDNLVLLLPWPGWRTPEQIESDIRLAVNIRKKTMKPIMAIVPYFSAAKYIQQASDVALKLQDGGVPAFATFERGACALRHTLDYYKFKSSIDA
jgi:acyl-CoA synthetase (NDP forming)